MISERNIRRILDGRFIKYEPAADAFREVRVELSFIGEYSPRMPTQFTPEIRAKCGSRAPNARKNWTDEEDQILMRHRHDGWTYQQLATMFGISRSSVEKRISELRDEGLLG